MAARRSGIPIKWTSEQIIDRDRVEVHFHHLKAFSKGMRVVWTFEERPEGVLVTIVHDMHFRIPALAPIANRYFAQLPGLRHLALTQYFVCKLAAGGGPLPTRDYSCTVVVPCKNERGNIDDIIARGDA